MKMIILPANQFSRFCQRGFVKRQVLTLPKYAVMRSWNRDNQKQGSPRLTGSQALNTLSSKSKGVRQIWNLHWGTLKNIDLLRALVDGPDFEISATQELPSISKKRCQQHCREGHADTARVMDYSERIESLVQGDLDPARVESDSAIQLVRRTYGRLGPTPSNHAYISKPHTSLPVEKQLGISFRLPHSQPTYNNKASSELDYDTHVCDWSSLWPPSASREGAYECVSEQRDDVQEVNDWALCPTGSSGGAIVTESCNQ